MDPVRMGFVGAGYMGQLAHIANYARAEGAAMLALAEPRPELARRVAEAYGVERVYRDHRELAADPDVEAVAAILPQQLVTPVVRDLLEAGKHVITEKPMGVAFDECADLAALAAERGLVYQVGYMKRHDTGVLVAKRMLDELLAAERLGELHFARVWCFGGGWQYGIDEPIRTDEPVPPDTSPARPFPEWIPAELQALYNRTLNVDSHVTNLLRFLIGDYDLEVAAWREGKPLVLQGWSARGVSCVFELGELSAPIWHEGVELYFAHGVLRIEPPPPLRGQSAARVVLHEMGDEPRTIEPDIEPGSAFAAQARHFLASVRGAEEAISPAADAARDVELAEDAVRLVAAGR